MSRGVAYALGAYLFWGLHPVYWKQLQKIPALEIVSHRILWSFVFFAIIISFRNEWKRIFDKVSKSRNKWILFTPAFLIGTNWATYIWAVNAGFIIETSLGYFICPLVSVFLGVFLLKEKLRTIQWLAVGIAAIGVLIMTFIYGQFPWIAIFLAGTWGLYGLLRKKSPLSAVEGLTLETALLSVPVIFYMVYLKTTGAAFVIDHLSIRILLISSGIISGLPLIIFIIGARLIALSTIGIIQYVYPILIFLVGVLVYNEPLIESRIIGLVFIWIAIIVYTVDGSILLKKTNRGHCQMAQSDPQRR